MDHKEHYDYKTDNDLPFQLPCALIQWKGTSVCLDVHCECGHHSHIDDEFTCYVRCSRCGKLYAVGCTVKLLPLPEDHKTYVESELAGLIKEDGQDIKPWAHGNADVDCANRLPGLLRGRLASLLRSYRGRPADDETLDSLRHKMEVIIQRFVGQEVEMALRHSMVTLRDQLLEYFDVKRIKVKFPEPEVK